MLNLLSFRGRTSRGTYLVSGASLMVLKYCIDHAIAARFGQPWSPLSYFLAPRDMSMFTLAGPPRTMYLTLWAVALPFFWIGVSLTIQRLRDAGLRIGWVGLFFIPVANLPFFLTLTVLPAARLPEAGSGKVEGEPQRFSATAMLGVVLATALGLALVALSTKVVDHYGWGLFLGVPFLIGFVSSWFLNMRSLHSVKQSIAVACLTTVLLGFVLVSFYMEGVICLLMALPLAIPFAIAGAKAAHICLSSADTIVPPSGMTACVVVIPLLILGESAGTAPPPVRPVTTSIVVNAPVHTVWQNVITFPPLAPPTELLFRSGIAYPIGAQISGEGVGAIRRCRFSTGDFVEPITTWDTDHLLAFQVASQPPSLNEIGFGLIHTAHNDLHYMRSQHGQFRLVALDANHTLLEGTTWYQDYFWPQVYWRGWSDAIVHRIHLRVLEHVRRQAEASAAAR